MVRIAAENILCGSYTELPKPGGRPWDGTFSETPQTLHGSSEPHPRLLGAAAEFAEPLDSASSPQLVSVAVLNEQKQKAVYDSH